MYFLTSVLFFVFASLWTSLANSTKELKEQRLSESGHVRRRIETATSEVQVPFFYGLGQGTTATRSFFHSMCHLNICAVHYSQMCFNVDEAAELTKEQAIAIEGQSEVVHNSYEFSVCAGRRGGSCPFDEGLALFRQVEEAVKKVILSGGVHYVADTPYPHLITFILKTLKEANPDSEPVFLMTERNPHDWAIKRMKEHGGDVICRYYMELEKTELAEFERENPNHNPLDWSHCMIYSKEMKNSQQPSSTQEVFVALDQLIKEAKGDERGLLEVVDRVTSAYAIYQKRVSKMEHMLFSINLFEQERFLSEDEISQQIYERMIKSDALPPSVKESLKRAGVRVMDPYKNRKHGVFHKRHIWDQFSMEAMHHEW